jgi:hypothetical protein
MLRPKPRLPPVTKAILPVMFIGSVCVSRSETPFRSCQRIVRSARPGNFKPRPPHSSLHPDDTPLHAGFRGWEERRRRPKPPAASATKLRPQLRFDPPGDRGANCRRPIGRRLRTANDKLLNVCLSDRHALLIACPLMDLQLVNKLALVTASTGGIGKQIVACLARGRRKRNR